MEEFTSRRNDLVKRLKKTGETDAAKHVATLKRPTIVAWAVNQIVHNDPSAVEELIDTQRAIGAVTDRESLQDLVRRRRELVARLTQAGVKALTDSGHPASTQTREKISTTLLATGDKDGQERLLAGTLERELSGGGLEGAFPGLPAELPGAPSVNPDARTERVLKEAQKLETVAWAAREKAESLTKEAARLKREADAAEREAQTAAREADRLDKKAQAARAKADR